MTDDAAITVSTLSFTSSGFAIASGTGSLTLGNAAAINVSAGNTATISAAIAGSNGLNVSGAGSLVLSGTNTYTGNTSVADGTLQVNSSAAIGGSGASVSIGTAGVLSAGYALDQVLLGRVNAALSTGVVALAVNSSNNLDVTGFGTVGLGATVNSTFSGTLTPDLSTYRLGGGGATLTIANPLTGPNGLVVGRNAQLGNVVLNGAQTYTGATAINGGILQLGTGATIFNSSGITINSNGLTTAFPGFGGGPSTRSGALYILGDGGTPDHLGSTPVTINGGELLYYRNNAAETYSVPSVTVNGYATFAAGPSSGTGGTLSVTNLMRNVGGTADFKSYYQPVGSGGAGADVGRVQILAANGVATTNTNGIVGGWAIAFNNDSYDSTFAGYNSATGMTAFAGTYQTSIASAATTDVVLLTSDQTQGVNTAIYALKVQGATLTQSAGTTLTIGSGGLIITYNNYNAALTGGTVTTGLASGELFVHVYDSPYADNGRFPIASVIADNGSTPTILVKSGTGPLTLQGTNTYTGNTYVNGGVVLAQSAGTSTGGPFGPIGAGTVYVNSGASVDTQNNDMNLKPFVIAGFGYDGKSGALINTSSGNAAGFQRVTLAADAAIGGTGRFDFRGNSPTLNLAGFTLTKTGTNLISLVATTVTAGNIVIDQGQLSIENGSTIAAAPGTTITINPNGQFLVGTYGNSNTGVTRQVVLNGGLIGDFYGSTDNLVSPIIVTVASTLSNNAAGQVFSGVISGTGSLTKIGTGDTTLTGANSFSGNLTVTGGSLVASQGNSSSTASNLGAIGSGTSTRLISVTSGATLTFTSNNVFGGGGLTPGSIPTLVAAGGTINSTRYNAIGNIILNGGTLAQSASDTGSYQGYQFLGTVTVGGTSASTISTGNGKGDHLLSSGTTFNVGTTGAAVDLTISAPLINASGDYGNSPSGFIKTGTGTAAFTAANTYSGGTTISAGTLQLGVANAVPSAGGLVLAGGTLSSGAMAGYSDALGVLSQTASSTIALGTGNHQLTFANATTASLNAFVGTLTITGWGGTAATSNTGGGQLLFTGLGSETAAQANVDAAGFLSRVSFTGYSNPAGEFIGTAGALELVPVPEPASLLGFAGGALWIVRRIRRRAAAC